MSQKLMVGMDDKDIFVGHEAKELKDVMNIESPIQRGQITNWDQMVINFTLLIFDRKMCGIIVSTMS